MAAVTSSARAHRFDLAQPVRRWWASQTYGAQRPARRMGALALLGSLSGVGEVAVVVLIVALVSAHQTARYPLVDRLPSSAWALAGLALAALALLALAHLGSAVIAARAGAEVQRTVQTRLVAGFLDAPWSAQAGARAGELQELATVKANNLAFGTQEGAEALGGALNLVMVIVAAALLSIWTTAALLASVALVIGFSRLLRDRRRQAMRGAVREASGLAMEITETALTARDIRVFGVTAAARRRLVERIDGLARRQQAVRTMAAATPPLTRDATVAVLVAGLAIVVTGTGVALPTLGASMILVLRSLAHAQALSGAALRLQEREDNLEHVEERLRLWRAMPRAGTRPCPSVDRVELREVSFTYPGAERPALDGVSLVIARGEQIGVVGPTGAGKSTLASVLLGLLSPDCGAVLIDGIALAALAPSDWHECTAWLGQEPHLLTGSVAENIRFLRPSLNDETVRAAALAASLGAELARWPDGLDHSVGPAGSALSGGERQRVALARALAGRPNLLVLDEPTSALDAHTEAAVRRALGTLRQDTALVVIAHRLSTVRLCDRIAVMQAGRIVHLAPPDELALTDAWFREALVMSTPDGPRPRPPADRRPAPALDPAAIRGARETTRAQADPPPVRHDLRWAARRAPLAAEAALVLSLASVAVRVLPVPRTTRLLGRPAAPDLPAPPAGPSPRARRVGHAVERVAARLPWHPQCLPQAIATRAMLRRRGIASEGHLGVVETAPFSAHAWVTVGGAAVQGGPVEHASEIAVLR